MIVAFDLETTGLDKKRDEIIEIALIKFDEKTFEQVEVYSTFINPGIPIPDIISNITNIFDGDIEKAPSLDDVKAEILDFIGDCPLLGHNVFFDRDFFIEKGIDISENIVIDTFFLANFLCLQEKSLNLEMLCKSFGISFSGAHRAINDVKATIHLFEKLIEKFHSFPEEKKKIFQYIFQKSEDKNIDFLRDFLIGENYSIDFGKFSEILLKKVGKYIDISEMYIDKEIKNGDFQKEFEKIGNVEKRENQQEMTKLVYKTFQEFGKSVIQAPTGLGKSFAYLIPSIIHSIKSGEKVFISTKTKTLQDQLYDKDLGLLKEKLGYNFQFTKLKGKSNYISIQAFFNEFLIDQWEYSKVNFLLKLGHWLFETKHGELDELNYYGVEFSYLKLIHSDSHLVLSDTNEYRDYEFLFKARSRLERSNIIVINHSLLFSDLKSETGVLGTIKNLVIDEAHNIEDSITDSLKQTINEKYLTEIFQFIENVLTKKNIDKLDIIKNKELLISEVSVLFDYAYSYLSLKNPQEGNYKNCLVKRDFFDELDVKEFLKKLELIFLDIIDKLSIIEEYDFSKEISSLQICIETLRIFMNIELDETYIKMISYTQSMGISLEYTLLNPGMHLEKHLWDNLQSVILTSATLKIGDTFDYFNNILHLGKFHFHCFESDFDYKKQATIFIPNDLGNIKNNNEEVVNFLGKFYSIVKGKTLTLLTSFNIIKKIYTNLNIDLKKKGIHLFPQSIGGSKIKLMSFYLDDPENSILLGTDSFWEGVDISGDNLKYLVIHKFPFGVPTDPIFQARSIFFQDPFTDYSIPKAIIKLQQGFGRLIRSKTDTGIVVLLDNRIINTNWGKAFYNAFPKEINIKVASSFHFLSVLEKSMKK